MKALLLSALLVAASTTGVCAAPVTDARMAMLIVYRHRQHSDPNIGSFETWKKSFQADLVQGTWDVAGKSWGPTTGACVYYVRASDGKYLGGGYLD